MKQSGKALWLLSAFLFAALLWPAPVRAASLQSVPAEDDTVRVLYLSSYSYAWGTVPLQIEGLREALPDDFVVNYEFMDTKNTVYSDGYREFYELLSYKMHSRAPYDAVVACDDAALKFVRQYQQQLFPQIPIVFTGVDNVQNGEAAAQNPYITGVLEQVDYAANLRLAHALFPDARRVVLILDNMENGVGIAQQLREQADEFSGYQVEYVNSSEYTKAGMCQKLASLTPDSLVFCISMGQQKGGGLYTDDEAYAMVRQYAAVPLFRMAQAGIGEGMMGGYVVDHKACAKLAGEMLLQMLQGQKPAVVTATPCCYCFDCSVLDKFGIRIADMPSQVRQTATFLNRRAGFLMRNAYAVMLMLAVAVVLACLCALCVYRRTTRTLRQKNEQLAAAVEQADSANRAKSRFLSQISHEIRTPMNAVVGLTAIARAHADEPARVEDTLGKIDGASHVLLNLLNDLLDMSAVEEGKLKIACSPFSLPEVLTGIAAVYRTQCRTAGISFVMAADLPEEMLLGDSLRINQILLNLISNACKFTPAGGEVRVLAKGTPRSAGATRVRITVSDTGIGMSEEMQARLFRPFEQESAATAQKYGGSGLGLSIAQKLAALMGGTITVESQKGRGTSFAVELPFACAQEMPQAGAVHGLRVLNADGIPMSAACTEAMLKRMGAECVSVDTGAQAAAYFAQHSDKEERCDVCFLNWDEPETGGAETVRELRAAPGGDALAIVACAGDTAEIAQAARAAGTDLFLTRPLFQSQMGHLLESLAGGPAADAGTEKQQWDFSGRRVLAAEDNALNREVVRGLLEAVHMAVDFACDGAEAVQRFAAQPPQTYAAVLMDVQMPRMNGYEATRAIRALGRADARTIPIFAMTADAFAADRATALASGMNGHIAKPIDVAQLYRCLQDAVELGQKKDGSAAGT